MRVLYFTNSTFTVSTNSSLGAWMRFLRPKGLEPVLVSHQTGDFQKWAVSEGVPCYQVNLDFPKKTWPFPFVKSVWQLRQIIRRHQVSLIHCNQHEIYPIAQYAARLANLPAAVSVRFTIERPFAEWLFGGRRTPSSMYFTSHGSFRACQPAIAGIVPESICDVIHNGKDTTHFAPDSTLRSGFRKTYGLGDGLVMGVACALRPVKQLEQCFTAVSRLPTAPQFLLAGTTIKGLEDYASEVVAAGRAILKDRFHFLGHLDDLRGFYNGIDLFVNTSLIEGFPNSVLESLSCGCPVVGYPSTSVDEAIEPASGGQIVPQNDLAALVEALQKWTQSRQMLIEARDRARRCGEHFDIRNSCNRLWDRYMQMVPEPAKVTAALTL